MNLELDLRAPVILIPERFTSDAGGGGGGGGGADGDVPTRSQNARCRDGEAQSCRGPVVVVQPGNLSVWSVKALHLTKMSRVLREMEAADAVDEVVAACGLRVQSLGWKACGGV